LLHLTIVDRSTLDGDCTVSPKGSTGATAGGELCRGTIGNCMQLLIGICGYACSSRAAQH